MYQPAVCGSWGAEAEPDVELPVWMIPRGVDLALLGRSSLAEVEPPDLRVRIVARVDGTLVAEVIEGVAPYDGDALVVLERRGAYEVLHRDVCAGAPSPRVRLTLAPWPSR